MLILTLDFCLFFPFIVKFKKSTEKEPIVRKSLFALKHDLLRVKCLIHGKLKNINVTESSTHMLSTLGKCQACLKLDLFE